MSVIIEKMAMMVILLASGYLFARYKVVSPDFNKGLSKLILNFFLVCMILSSVINKEMTMSGKELLAGIGFWFIAVGVCFVCGIVTPRLFRMNDGDSAMYSLLVTFMNNGFVGFPLVIAVYGADSLFYASLSNIPFNIFLYTVGIMMLSRGKENGKLDIRRIFCAPLVATLVSVAILVSGIRFPQLIVDTVNTVGNATVPLSMMCVGMSLGGVSVKDAFGHPRLYIISFMRLIVCPLLIWLVLHGMVHDKVMLGTIILLMSAPCAVICTILGLEYGRDGIESSESILLTTLLSVITIPLLIHILGL